MATDLETIDEQIAVSITEPLASSVEGESVTARPLTEMLDARDRIETRQAVRRRKAGWKSVGIVRGQTQGAGRS